MVIKKPPKPPIPQLGTVSRMGPPNGGGGVISSFRSQLAAASGSRYNEKDPPIYMGGTASSPFYSRQPGKGVTTPLRAKTLSSAMAEFAGWSVAERNKWGDRLFAIGLIDEDETRDYGVLSKTWEYVVQETASAQSQGRRYTPWKMAEIIAGFQNGKPADNGRGGRSGGKSGGGGGGGGGSTRVPFSGTKTTQSVDLTDPDTARGLIHDTLKKALGREAKPEEIEAFTNVLHSAQRSRPTTTATTYVNDEQTGSTTSGGMTAGGAQQLMLEEAQKKPDWGAFQASTTVFDWLQQALKSPV